MDMRQYPDWLKQSFSPNGVARDVRSLVSDLGLTTVCESALCPNLSECYSQRQLTFMILGETCTRRCHFCAVSHGRPHAVPADEPQRVADAVHRLNLSHVVITSVARDDMPDEGAGHFVQVVKMVRLRNPNTTIELLVPDFHARYPLIQMIMDHARPEVFAHNVETIERLSPVVRPSASYWRSLEVLGVAASLGTKSLIKSSLMVGLGETAEELLHTFGDLRAAGVTHLTIGQYLRPDAQSLPVAEYVTPEQFRAYERLAYQRGFAWVTSGPFVRSSYHAIDAISARAGA
ncbi:MAG: lipoyl synthase [Candidatus Omnitrophica bacterium]|nr:lipoyl synthase [Candidatus Omnitrophota bacterium]